MPVHDQVLEAANRIANNSPDGSFTPEEVVRALPHLNENTVRTHVVSRCCVNAPKNHLHKWEYFRRVGRGTYRVEPAYRQSLQSASLKKRKKAAGSATERGAGQPLRDTIHAVIQRDMDTFVADCLEIAVVTQGNSLDEVVKNLKDAIELHLDGEDLSTFGLSPNPRLQLTYDVFLAS
jgi:predicted RNase H-like HicB family nuclease